MDFVDLIEKIWDKAGAFGVIGLVLWITVRRVAAWLEPKASETFKNHNALVTTLTKTSVEHAEANAANAENIQKITASQTTSQKLLEDIHQRLAAKACLVFFAFTLSIAGAQETPIGASIRVTNGGTSCSGTVFSVGEQHAAAVGAAHCFAGKIGGQFDCNVAATSGSVKATLLAIDRDTDLALWKLPASAVKDAAELPREEPAGPMTAVGYPGGVRQPRFKRLKYADQFWCRNNAFGLQRDDSRGTRIVWECRLTEGEFGGGDSGGGVFLGGRLAGVMTNGGSVCTGKSCETRVYCTTWQQVRAFVDRHHAQWADCEGREQLAGKDVPPPPNDKTYDGKGPRPPDLDSDKGMACEIDKLRKELAECKLQIANCKLQIGPKGDPGAKGEPGPKGATGENATDAQVAAAVAKWVEDHGEKWLDEHREKIRGPAGTVTVILKWADGAPIKTLSDLRPGSRVTLPLTKTITEPK